MEIIKRTINDNIYTFVCETWETSRTWGHKVTMFRNNIEYTTQRITYQNRTWESYPFKSCILKCINYVIDEEEIDIINDYKETNNIQRLTQDKKDEITNNSKVIKELKELKATL